MAFANTRALSIALAAGIASLSVTACSQGESEEVAAEEADGIAGLDITDGRLMLPAVAGNPAAIYFTIANSSEKNITLRRADVAGAAKAELHEMTEWDGKMTMSPVIQLVLEPGTSVDFEPGGRHVMVFDLAPDYTAGGSTEVTLTVAGGDKHSFDVPIKAAGEER
jgi:copper(I)-binding protein